MPVFRRVFSDAAAQLSRRIAFAAQSDCVRCPIRFRPPSDQIAFAARSDCVRCPMTRRELFNRRRRVCQHSRVGRPEGAKAHSPGPLGFAACQSKKGNSLIIRLLPLQGVGLVWRIFTQGVLALASGKAERPWAMCFCPFGASYS